MRPEDLIWFSLIVIVLIAMVVDFRSRKIPNWLTVPAFIVGLTLRTVLLGWPGAKTALEGTGLALVLLLPLVLMRALGAGDWKLMGAVGAFLGPLMFLFVLAASFLVSGIMAVVEMARTRRVRETFRNLSVLVQGFFSFGLKAHPQISLDNPELLKLPFGVAVAIATIACYCAARFGI